MPQKSAVKKGKKSTKITKRNCNKELRFINSSPFESYLNYCANYAKGTFAVWKPIWKR